MRHRSGPRVRRQAGEHRLHPGGRTAPGLGHCLAGPERHRPADSRSACADPRRCRRGGAPCRADRSSSRRRSHRDSICRRRRLRRSLGAAHVVDYRTTTISDVLTDADAALVPFPGQTRLDSLRAVRRGGVLVSLLGSDDEALTLASERGVRYRSMMVQSDHAGMQAIADIAAAGALHAKIHSTVPLCQAAEAHRLGEAGKIDGKLVLIP
ncbi:zinc-binding dehydrogenase [Streptomyces sp. NPDC046984]|uniref:zinc-binding dehydrogenase n=1 Tax=Streptomyces sp. NPDC046984 TaxID=3155138 RepID=UPI0033F15DF0